MSPIRQSARADTEPTPTEVSDRPPIRTHAHLDTIVPTPPIAVTPTASLVPAPVKTTVPLDRGITSATKVGLVMIPVVVFMVATYILFLLWYRKQRAAREQIRNPPPVAGKDVHSYDSSRANCEGSGKVLHMAAFSAPVHNGQHRKTRCPSQSVVLQEQGPEGKDDPDHATLVAAPVKDPRTETDLDSPIDGSSPFRLKRGDTVKRYSLGPELARLWPSPTTPAWTKPLDTNDNLLAPVHRENSVFEQRPGRNQR